MVTISNLLKYEARIVTWILFDFSMFWFLWLGLINWIGWFIPSWRPEPGTLTVGQNVMLDVYLRAFGRIFPVVDNFGFNAVVFLSISLVLFFALQIEYGAEFRRATLTALELGLGVTFVHVTLLGFFDWQEINLQVISTFQPWGLGWFTNMLLLAITIPLFTGLMAYESLRH